MARTRITSKGQVTIPKDVRERLGLRPGDEIEFAEEGGTDHIAGQTIHIAHQALAMMMPIL